jgi:N-acetylglucosaminyl-diphospho-decaprenol L-rhamnosyltransferase
VSFDKRQNMRLSVVIVVWNARGYLEECLRALFDTTRGLELDVHVVDNGSEDGTADMVESRFPRIRLARSAENLGYARANNVALRLVLDEGKADHVLLLNSDVVLGDGAVEGLVAALEADPAAGAAAPALILPDGKFQAGAGGALPTVGSGLAYFLFLSRLFPRLFQGFFVHAPYFAKRGRPVRLGWLSGACIVLPRRALEATGLLNEEYFFYLEDVDMGRRMRDGKFTMLFVPSVRVLHHHGITYRVVRGKVNTEWLRRLFAYVRKEHGRVAGLAFRVSAVAGFFLRLAGRAALALFTRAPSRKERLREAAAYFTFSLTGRGNHAINH